MKLLIITQVVDTKHPILGFFHRWVEEFAKHCEHVHVVVLQVGDHNLPANVTVHSLGKEEGKGRLAYLLSFYRLIWSLRREYDAVFVHMNQVYVVLGAWLWKLFKKRIALWYTHGAVSVSLKIATTLSDVIFTASKDSFRITSKKVIVTGHGIDTQHFKPQSTEKNLDLVTVGRVSSVKRLDRLVDIVAQLQAQHEVSLTIVGGTLTSADEEYKMALQQQIMTLGVGDKVQFLGTITQADLPATLSRAKIFVTTAENGSLDKAMLEAMAVGLPVISMARGSRSLPLGADQVDSEKAFIEAIHQTLLKNEPFKSEYVDFIERNHSLTNLVKYICKTI